MRRMITGSIRNGEILYYIEPTLERYERQRSPYLLFTNRNVKSSEDAIRTKSVQELKETLKQTLPRQKGYVCMLNKASGEKLSVEDIMFLVGTFIKNGVFPNIIIDELANVCGIHALLMIEFLKEYNHGDVLLVLQSISQIVPVNDIERYLKYVTQNYNYISLARNGGAKNAFIL